MKRVLVIMNDWPWKMAGGSNYHTIKAIQYWTTSWHDTCFDVLLPRLGYAYARRQLPLKGEALITDSPLERETASTFGRVLVFSSRILRVVRSPPKRPYDVIIASSHYLTDVLPAVYVQRRNPASKLIAYYHSALVSERSLGMSVLRKASDACAIPLLRRYADLVFAINQPIQELLIAHGVDKRRVLVTNNGVDHVASDVPQERPVYDACFVGRLERGKGIFDLVTIWKDVVTKVPGAKLVIIGDGREKERLINLIKKERLERNIVLCGFIEEEQKFELLRTSKLFVLPSSVDAWGIVIAEALSCGVPVIAYDLPAFRTIWGQYITYASEGDIASFSAEVVALLRDEQRRSELARRGLEKLRGLLWVDIAQQEARSIEAA